jgi:hypothetical protein
VQQFPEKNFKIRFDIVLRAPTIFIPINFRSNEGIFIDLGQLTLQTHFLDDPNRSFIEQQMFIFKNLLASRVNLNTTNEIIGDIVLLECAEFHTSIDRLLHSRNIKNEPEISVKVDWETIDLNISKNDYSCLMKIWRENFSEKIYHENPPSTHQEQSKDEQTNQEIPSFDGSIKKQTNSSNDQTSEKFRLDFQIKKIGLTLFLEESDLNVHGVIRNENSKFICMQIEMIEAHFQYLFDSSYHGEAQIQCFLLEDLRQTNLSNSNKRLLDRNDNVDRNAQMFIVTVKFKPKTETNTTDVQQGK